MPLTYDDLINARDKLLEHNRPTPMQQHSLTSEENFKHLMYLAKNYPKSTQFVRRNHLSNSKRTRCRKTFKSMPIQIVNENCLSIAGVLIMSIGDYK